MKRFFIQISALSVGILIGLITCMSSLSSCSRAACDGKKCKVALGLQTKSSQRDSIFYKENSTYASKFNVFIENSVSMNGYVSGHTEFKTTIHRMIGQVVADVLENDTNVSLNFINSEIEFQGKAYKRFSQKLDLKNFAAGKGNRATTDLIEIIDKVVNNTPKGAVSMFVSDCVYSPESSADINKALKKQQTDMLNILKNKAKSDPTFGILIYRLMSDFSGIYYNKTDSNINCKGPRPYFIWFMGDQSILAGVQKSLTRIVSDQESNYIVGIPGYGYMPYKTLRSDHPYHYLSAKAGPDSIFRFSFYADHSRLPLPEEYIVDKNNYAYANDKRYFLKKIDFGNQKDSKGNEYDCKYTVSVRGKKNSLVSPTMVEISIKSMLVELPEWVTKYDDPDGTDYDKGYNPGKQRTFGIKSLIEGIAEFYNEPYYATYKVQIN